MGAALTYARRYALFTLVGIAGEDDLDAPNLAEGGKADAANTAGTADIEGAAVSSQPGDAVGERRSATAPRRTEKVARPARTVLGQEQSAALRENLLADLSQLQSGDEAADWVHKNLAAKNTLITSDADAVEAGFREKLATIEVASATRQEQLRSAPAEDPEPPAGKPFVTTIEDAVAAAPPVTSENPGVRHRRVAAKTIRLRDKEHCKFVRAEPCVVCGRAPTEAHHIRFAQPRALGRKVSDEYTVPVCRLHHRDLHGYGDEASWWAGVGIDPLPIALELWRRSRLTYSLDATGVRPASNRRSRGPPWTTPPGTGSTWLNILKAALDDSALSLPVELTRLPGVSRHARNSGLGSQVHLPQLLDDVERGETLVITRHGRAIARIVPEAHLRQAEVDTAIANIKALRQRAGKITVEELVSAKHEGHKC